MKILSIEPTPSPNTMKVILNEELPAGKSNNYKQDQQEGAPPVIKEILAIEGVKGVYHVADFFAVERNARFDWRDILPQVRLAFGDEEEFHADNEQIDDHFGEVKVQVQIFKGIPMQIKLNNGREEKRFAMGDNYTRAISAVQLPGDNVVLMRKWHDHGVRYGDLLEIGEEVIEELIAAYPQERLNLLIERGKNPSMAPSRRKKLKLTLADLEAEDWRVRYQLLEQMDDPELSDLPVLKKALQDEKASIRRLATVYLGMIKDKKVLPLLYQGLKDKTVTVQRTAGDCLSDLGFSEAAAEMMLALQDKSKLVRWRAAMFLYEAGDETALPALKAAEDDPEFEVRMQIKLAIERIEQGEKAKGSVWKQMTEARKQK
ncbi:conserved virulence factor C family protein [Bacillaceae bacterium Marseille-Q3522]|nr:conserved virulence factor C family protein [Bacillaceae bacterium Marseille-Q3522]